MSDIRKTFPDFKIFPESDKNEHLVVKYIETRRQSRVLGFDLMSDPICSKITAKAQDTGIVAITDTIPVSAIIKTDIRTPIFSIYIPIYRAESKDFQGIISAVIVPQDLFADVFGKNLPQDLGVKISNGSTTIYHHEGNVKKGQVLTASEKITVADMEWNIDFSAAEEFALDRVTQVLPVVFFLFGLPFSIIFALAVYFIFASRERAVILSKNITAQIEAVITSIGEGLFATDREGNIILVNRVFGNILGWQADEIYGKKFHQVLTILDENKKPISENALPITRVLRGGVGSTTTNVYFQRKDKTIFPVALNTSPTMIGGGG